jgi:DNA-binding PadR family transcriptional regulator
MLSSAMPTRDEIPPGTLDMLILTTLSRSSEMHGFEIAEAIQEHSEQVLRVEEGSLYPSSTAADQSLDCG